MITLFVNLPDILDNQIQQLTYTDESPGVFSYKPGFQARECIFRIVQVKANKGCKQRHVLF